MNDNEWEEKLRLYLQGSFLDYRRLLANSVNLLAIHEPQRPPIQSHAALISTILDYFQQCNYAGGAQYVQASDQFDLTLENSIVSIRGAPRLSLLQYLGQGLKLDPAILLEHFNFPDTFRISPLPSQHDFVLRICMISLGFWGKARDYRSQRELDERTRQRKVDLWERDHSGTEQCRRVNLHQSNHFSVEQDLSFFVYARKPRPWGGVLFNDCGTHSINSPWCNLSSSTAQPRFYPMKRSGQCALDLTSLDHPLHDARDQRNYISPDPCQSRGDCGESMSPEDQLLCAENPVVFICDLLATSALSWGRFFDFLRTLYNVDSVQGAERAVNFLRREKLVLEHARSYFDGILSFLQSEICLKPRFSGGIPEASMSRAEEIVRQIQKDFKNLNQSASALSRMCSEMINIEMSTISILESQKGLAQAQRIELLTVAAFIFLPISLVSSIFGMNVESFTNPNPPIGTFFKVAVPVTAACLMIPLWPWMYHFLRNACSN